MTVKEKILSNTTNFFMQEGCKKVTMDEIANYNCMSKRTLYENFIDKYDLVEQCVLFATEITKDHYKDTINKSSNVLEVFLQGFSESGSKVIRNYLGLLDDVRKYFPEIYRNTAEKVKANHRDLLISILNKGKEDGLIVDFISSEDLGKALVCVMKASVTMNSDKDFWNNHQEMFKAINFIYLRGLATEKGRITIDKYFANKDNK